MHIYIYIYTKIKPEIYELHCNIKYKATPVKIAGNSTLKLFNYICLFMLCAPVNVWQSQDTLQESSLLPPGGSWRWIQVSGLGNGHLYLLSSPEGL